MMILEVGCELLAAVENLGALVDAAGREWEMAAPSFDLVMLGVFVTFPIVFGAKGFTAGGIGAAVGAGVTLFVFPEILRLVWVMET